MNHLAHALLSGNDDDLRLGGLMGDFVHGQPDPEALPPGVIDGIRLHRAIDQFTDAHPVVIAAKALLPPPYRRYAGILVDMWFDHDLARDFERWAGQPLDAYSDALRALLHERDSLLPDGLKRFRDYMDARDLPAGYADPAEIGRAFHGISGRLRRDNPIASALPVMLERDAPLQLHFEAFFPELQGFAREWVGKAKGRVESGEE
jgi:acyl carrier protein phosphodiesterase